MKGKTVEQSDLIGAIKDFPIEVVQEMVNEQVRQGNNADVAVFQEYVYAGIVRFGFDWSNSVMGDDFWNDVLYHKKFDIFFQKYPKTQSCHEQKCISIEVPDGYEIDNDKSTFTNIVFKPIACKYPKSWEDAFNGNPIFGYRIGRQCYIEVADTFAEYFDKNVFKTEKQAKSALAYAQITQLMALPCYNGDWIPDWDDADEGKYVPYRCNSQISCIPKLTFNHVAFKSYNIYKAFIENHEDLLRQYFEMY